LFVGELIRNRRLTLESQARLEALVETSPAAVAAIDEHSSIELANQAAIDLLVPREGHLVGDPIAAFLPELHHPIRWEEAPQFRASLQCLGTPGQRRIFHRQRLVLHVQRGVDAQVRRDHRRCH
jgi:PAS domain-containing protein